MIDNLNARDDGGDAGRERPRRASEQAQPLSDREVPLGGTTARRDDQRWLDGDTPETSVRRAEWSRDVDFWKRMNEDLERRRRMRTPAHVQGRIMEAIPQHAPQMITPWWRREFVVTPTRASGRRSDPPGRRRGRDRRRPASGALIGSAPDARAADHVVVGRFVYPATGAAHRRAPQRRLISGKRARSAE